MKLEKKIRIKSFVKIKMDFQFQFHHLCLDMHWT